MRRVRVDVNNVNNANFVKDVYVKEEIFKEETFKWSPMDQKITTLMVRKHNPARDYVHYEDGKKVVYIRLGADGDTMIEPVMVLYRNGKYYAIKDIVTVNTPVPDWVEIDQVYESWSGKTWTLKFTFPVDTDIILWDNYNRNNNYVSVGYEFITPNLSYGWVKVGDGLFLRVRQITKEDDIEMLSSTPIQTELFGVEDGILTPINDYSRKEVPIIIPVWVTDEHRDPHIIRKNEFYHYRKFIIELPYYVEVNNRTLQRLIGWDWVWDPASVLPASHLIRNNQYYNIWVALHATPVLVDLEKQLLYVLYLWKSGPENVYKILFTQPVNEIINLGERVFMASGRHYYYKTSGSLLHKITGLDYARLKTIATYTRLKRVGIVDKLIIESVYKPWKHGLAYHLYPSAYLKSRGVKFMVEFKIVDRHEFARWLQLSPSVYRKLVPHLEKLDFHIETETPDIERIPNIEEMLREHFLKKTVITNLLTTDKLIQFCKSHPDAIVTEEHVRRTGACRPGIEAFKRKYGLMGVNSLTCQQILELDLLGKDWHLNRAVQFVMEELDRD